MTGRIPVSVGVLPGFRGGPALSSVPYRGASEQIGWHINPLSLRTSSIMTWIGLPRASGPSHLSACVSRCLFLHFSRFFRDHILISGWARHTLEDTFLSSFRDLFSCPSLPLSLWSDGGAIIIIIIIIIIMRVLHQASYDRISRVFVLIATLNGRYGRAVDSMAG